MLTVHHSGTSWYLDGTLDAEGASALLRELRRDHTDVRIDGSRVDRIDGAGLTALAVARCDCHAGGHQFAVTAVPPTALHGLRVAARFRALFEPPLARVDGKVPDALVALEAATTATRQEPGPSTAPASGGHRFRSRWGRHRPGRDR